MKLSKMLVALMTVSIVSTPVGGTELDHSIDSPKATVDSKNNQLVQKTIQKLTPVIPEL